MADAMDTRIVEMQFQNKNFEKNIATSQKSLEKFKKELNFDEASKGLKEFSKSVDNVNLATMENNIQKLTDKFTGLGNVGEFVLSRIRRSLEGMGDQVIRFVDSLTTAQTKAGFIKYESLNKSVQTLRSATGKEEKEIYGVLERLTKYTDQTSYDFAQGVTSISQLVSSGAANLAQAETVVEGFYNYAAKAGADTTKAAHALEYSMVQALQRGFLDWGNAKELSRQSLLTGDFREQLLETAVALGTVTKEGNKYYAISKKSKKHKKVEVNTTNLFNDSLQHQWATTKVLNKTLEKYADTNTEFGAKAYAAAQRCTTFTDALNAWKDMLSTGWMQTYRTVFGDLADAMSLFSAVCDKVSESLDGLVQTRNKILESWKELGGRESFMGMLFGEMEDPDGTVLFKGAYGILDIITKIGDMISDGWWNMVMNLIPDNDKQAIVDEVNNNIDAINAALARQGLGDMVITKPFESFEELWNSDFFKATGGREGAFGGGLADATKKVQEFVANVHEWFNTIDESSGMTRIQKIQKILNAVINTISFGFDILGGIIDFIGMIGGQLTESFDAVGTFFSVLAGGIEEGEQSARKGGKIREFFTKLAEVLRPVTGAINSIVTSFFKLLTAIIQNREAGDGVVGVWEKIKSVLSGVWTLIKAISGPIVGFIVTVMDALTGLFNGGFTEENVAKFKETVSKAFRVMVEGIKSAVKPVYDKIKQVLKELWETVSEKIGDYFSDENSIGYKVISWIRKTVQKLKEGLNYIFPGATESIKKFFTGFGDNVGKLFEGKSLFGKIKESLKGFVDRFRKLFKDGFLSGLKEIGKSIANIFKSLFSGEGLVDGTNQAVGILERLGNLLTKPGSLGEGFLIIFRKIKDWWNSLSSESKALVVIGVVVVAIIGKLIKTIHSISDGLGELVSVIKGDFSKSRTKTLSEKILMIGVGVALITASIYTLANMKLDKGIQGLAGFEIIIFSLVGWMAAMKAVTKGMTVGDAAKIAIGVLGISSAIRRIVAALLPIAKVDDEQLKRMGWALLGITGALTLLMGIAKIGKFSWGSGGGMLLFAIAIGILINQLESLLCDPKKIAVMDFLKKLFQKMIDNFVAVAAIGWALGNASKGLFGVAAVAVAIGVLLVALKQIKDLDVHELVKMGVVMAVVMTALAGFVYVMGRMKNSKGLKDSDLWQLIFLAVSIGGLILVLQQVANMEWEQLGKMGATFGVVIAGIAALVAVVNACEGVKGRGLKGTGLFAVVGLAIGILGLILVLQQVANMDWEQLGKMGATFGVIILGLIAMIATIGASAGSGGRGFKGAGIIAGIAAVVLGIAGLVLALSKVADMGTFDIVKMLATYGVIMAGLIALVRVIGESEGAAGRGFKGAGLMIGLFALVHEIHELLFYMMPLTKMSWTELSKMWISMIVIFGGINRFLRSVPTHVNAKGVLATIVMIAGFVVGIWGLIEVLKPLASQNWESLTKAGIGFVVLAVGMVSSTKKLLKATNSMNKDSLLNVIGTLAIMAGFIGSIHALIEVLQPLCDMSWGQLAKAGVGFALLSVILITATRSLVKSSKLSTSGGLAGAASTLLMMVGLAGAMYILSLSLKKIKNVKTGTILAFTVGLGVLMLTMSKSMQIAGKMNPKGALVGLVALVAGLAAVMGVIGLIGPWMLESIGKSLPPLGEGLKVLGDSVKSFSESTSGISNSNIQTALDLIKGVSQVQFALTRENISLAVFSSLTGKNIDKGNLTQFGADMAAVGGFIAEFCDAIKDSDFTNVEKAVDALTSIASVEQTLTRENIELAVFEKLTGVAIEKGNLTAFCQNIKDIAPILQEAGDALEQTNFDNFGQAGTAMLEIAKVNNALTGQNIAIAVFEGLTGKKIDKPNLTQFGEDIQTIAPMLQSAGDALEQTNFDNFEKASTAMLEIAKVNSALTGQNIAIAVFESLTGKNIDKPNLTQFGEDIQTIAPMLQSAGDKLKDTDFDNFGKASSAMLEIAKVNNALTGQNIAIAVFEGLTGKNIKQGDIKSFANDVVTIAPELARISSELEGKSFDNVGKAGEALKSFADIQGVLSDQGIREALANAVLDILGSDDEVNVQDLETFGNQLVPLGQSIAKFADSVTYITMANGEIKSIDTENFTMAIKAVEALTGLQTALPTIGGIFDWITGHQETLPEFASGLGYLGTGIRNIYDNIYDLEAGNAPDRMDVQNLSTIITGLSDLISHTHFYGGDFANLNVDRLITALKDIIDLASPDNAANIEQMTKLLVSIADAANGLRVSTSVDTIYDALEEMVYDTELERRLNEAGAGIADKIADGINSDTSLESVTGAVLNLLREMAGSMMSDLFYDSLSLNEILGAELDESEYNDVTKIIETIESKISDAGETGEWSFRDVGFYLAAGIAAGVNQGTYLIEQACRNAIQKARIAAMEESDENSPSRVFMLIGEYISEGTAIGIDNGSGEVEEASKNMIQNACDALNGKPVVTKSFLEWFIDQQTDNTLMAIEDDEERIHAALDKFNKLPDFAKYGMLEKYTSEKTSTPTLNQRSRKDEEQLLKDQEAGVRQIDKFNSEQRSQNGQSWFTDILDALGNIYPLANKASDAIKGLGKQYEEWNKQHEEYVNSDEYKKAQEEQLAVVEKYNKEEAKVKAEEEKARKEAMESGLFGYDPSFKPLYSGTELEKTLSEIGKYIPEVDLFGKSMGYVDDTVTDVMTETEEERQKRVEHEQEVWQQAVEALSKDPDDPDPTLLAAMETVLDDFNQLVTVDDPMRTGKVLANAFTSVLNGGVEITPTVTPIMDLTEVHAGEEEINEMFGPRNINLSANGNRYARENVPESNDAINGEKSIDIHSIIESIANLGSRIDGVSSAVSHMQIVMNTGALVGQVTPGVNRNLGAKAKYNRRRN